MKSFWTISVLLLCVVFSAKANNPVLCYLEDATAEKNVSLPDMIAFYANQHLEIEEAISPDLYLLAYQWYKTPYRYGGNSEKGIDCSSYAGMLYNEAFNIPVTGNSRELFEVGEDIGIDELREGDLVFFKINSSRITHVGVYLQNGKFTHASSSKGVIISDLSEPYWAKYFYRGARVSL
jgi:lipoprotein Spr